MEKYFKQYKWSNIAAMLRNQKLGPEICTDDFNNRLVVITGATSGIGFATAQKFAAHGAELLCINRNEQKSKEMCEAITSQYGTKCTYWIADLSRLSEVHAIGEKLVAVDRNIDVFIHNAGVYAPEGTPVEIRAAREGETLHLTVSDTGWANSAATATKARTLSVKKEKSSVPERSPTSW